VVAVGEDRGMGCVFWEEEVLGEVGGLVMHTFIAMSHSSPLMMP